MKIYYSKGIGAKSGKTFDSLVLDLGYRKEYLTFNASLIAEILDVTARELSTVSVGDYEIGEIKDSVSLEAPAKGGK